MKKTKNQSLKESQIIKKCQEGNTKPYGELFKDYFYMINVFKSQWHLDRDTLLDAYQESHFRILKTIQNGKIDISKINFKSYIFRVMYCFLCENYKSRKKHTEILNNISFNTQENNHEIFETEDVINKIALILANTLTEEEQEILELRKKGMKYEIIADIIGRSEIAIRSIVYRLKKRYRKKNLGHCG